MSIRIMQMQAAMVIEQDFILQIRRLQRAAEPHYVFNILFSEAPSLAGNFERLDAAHDTMQSFAAKAGGEFYGMTNADGFLVLPASVSADPATYAAALVKAVMADAEPTVQVYYMPRDYVSLRERVNHYMEVAKDIAANKADDPERNLQADGVQGPLTAYALSQIERLVDDMDIARYARSQRIMQRGANGWAVHYEEHFVSMADMAYEKFPRLTLHQSRLMAELGAVLDKRMLTHMLGQEGWQGRAVGFNLSAKTVLSSAFAQFCHVVHGAARGNVTFEINISDVFDDVETFINALTVLRTEGFRVALDDIALAALPLLNLAALPVDDIKIRASAASVPQLAQPAVLQALRALPAGKIIFNRVDTPQAQEIGASLGITKFQGFYIDGLGR